MKPKEEEEGEETFEQPPAVGGNTGESEEDSDEYGDEEGEEGEEGEEEEYEEGGYYEEDDEAEIRRDAERQLKYVIAYY